ncbi:hypothetical protein BV25DRAFT_1885882 [Artomyces pyxidatus]|uniref:Uncharacterized protein n=1 Tax=Artomyces pyxidatus TaxID=48021 RepID=A0ACB8T1N5_9AGAM|nr:hypothetical protein BV25DRAFT_1885882 [Artomyces pyxidatus]
MSPSLEVRASQPPRLTIDASYAPELVEFWAQKYQEIKKEMDVLQQRLATQPNIDTVHAEQTRLTELVSTLRKDNAARGEGDRELREMLKTTKREADTLREVLVREEKEKGALRQQLIIAEKGLESANRQVLMFYTQCTALALEADQSRQKKIVELFEPANFYDPSMRFSTAKISQDRLIAVLHKLQEFSGQQNPPRIIHLLPRPPKCMPLRVMSCGEHGYWFYPVLAPKDPIPFELVVEGEPDNWLYLGRYTTAEMQGSEMKLSEWMTLDELTKAEHCLRVTSESLPPGQYASHAAQLDLKRRYDSGEWCVPCYSLRCVAFDVAFYDALHAAAAAEPVGKSSKTVPAKRAAPDAQAPDGKAQLPHPKGGAVMSFQTPMPPA